jgi:hypothetical protein
MWLKTKHMHPSFQVGNSTWLIDYATINLKSTHWRRKTGFFTKLYWDERKMNIQNCRNTPGDLHSRSRSWFPFPCFGIENLANFLKNKKTNFQLKKHFFPPKKIPSFCPNKQHKHWARCKLQLSKTSKFACPWTILIISLTSVKPRRAVLGKNWTSGLGYIHTNFSNLFYFTNCWTDAQKNTMNERFLHFDENMEKLSIYWRYP